MTLEKFIAESTRHGYSMHLEESDGAVEIWRREKGRLDTWESLLVDQVYDSRAKTWRPDYPSLVEWGTRAWSCMSLERARARSDALRAPIAAS
jgi:hypothetical protein